MAPLPVNSFSPPCPSSGWCGSNAPGAICPNAPLDAGGAQQHPGHRLKGAEHLRVLWALGGQEPMLWPEQAVYQGHKTHSWLSLPLLDLAHRLSALTEPAQRGVTVALLRLQLLCTPECHPPLCPRASPSLPAASPLRVGEH